MDTDILISFLRGDEKAVTVVKKLEGIKKPLRTTIVTTYELLKGASISSKPEENLLRVRRLVSGMEVLTLHEDACEEASKISKELRASGRMISEFDILIAGIVIHNDELLVSGDDHFGQVQVLKFEKW